MDRSSYDNAMAEGGGAANAHTEINLDEHNSECNGGGGEVDFEPNSDSEPDEYEQCDCIDSGDPQSRRAFPCFIVGKLIPFSSVFMSSDDCRDCGYFIPAFPVHARIGAITRDSSGIAGVFNPYLYTIELEHSQFKWSVQRRYNDFAQLHARLLLHRASEKVKAPVRRSRYWHPAAATRSVAPHIPGGRTEKRSPFHSRSLEETFGIDLVDDEKPAYPVTVLAADPELGDAPQPQLTAQSTPPRQLEPSELTRPSEDTVELTDLKPASRSKGTRSADTTARGPGKKSRHVSHATCDTELESASSEALSSMWCGCQVSFIAHCMHRCPRGGDVHSHSVTPIPVVHSADGTCSHAAGDRSVRHKACKLPPFPQWPELMVGDDGVENRRAALEKYLQGVLHIASYRMHHETAEFLNVTRYSFVHNLGGKFKEGDVKKRPGGRKHFEGWKLFCIMNCTKWHHRHVVVKDSCLFYIRPRDDELRDVLLLDSGFFVTTPVASETQGVKYVLTVHNLHRFVDGKHYMRHVANMIELAQEEILIADWWLSPEIYLKRPMTEGNRWRLDEVLRRKAEQGVRIFVLLYKEMEMALGISSLYSKRTLQGLHENIKVIRHPDHMLGTGTFLWAHHEKLVCVDQNIAFVGGIDLCWGRWDNAQHRLVDEGSVKYNQPIESDTTLAGGMRMLAKTVPLLTMESSEVAQLKGDSATAGVDQTDRMAESQRSDAFDPPGTVPTQDTSGAATPHESGPVVVYQKSHTSKKPTVARFKALAKRVGRSKSETAGSVSAPEQRAAAADGVLDGTTKSADKALEDEKAVHCDMATFVKQYRSAVTSGQIQEQKMRGDTPPPEDSKRNVVSKAFGRWKGHRARRKLPGPDDDDKMFGKGYELNWLKVIASQPDEADFIGMGGKMWLGKDYVNFIFKDFTDLEEPFNVYVLKKVVGSPAKVPLADFIERSVTPRMPWHDIHACVYGAAARDVARHFIERWNTAKVEKLKWDDSYPFLLPKSYDNVQVPRVFRNMDMTKRAKMQILRSASTWSVGMGEATVENPEFQGRLPYEDSIQSAYLHMIANAQHYIYIENQFFVSLIGHPEVRNEICKVLCDRIERAHKLNEDLRVYIMIPLMPGFEGQLNANGGSALQAVMHWTFHSLCAGDQSLFVNLLRRGVDNPDKYVMVGSLRTYDRMTARHTPLVSEILYIHSKLIIVDDKRALIGSANINDRSQRGFRDSEMAVYVEDVDFVPSTLAGKPFRSGAYAGSLRRHLFKEHLGLLRNQVSYRRGILEDPEWSGGPLFCDGNPPDLDDCVSDHFWNDVWWKTARNNTALFEKVFRCYPTDTVESLADLENHTSQMTLAEYDHRGATDHLRQVQGHLVVFPLKFLRKSNLLPSMTTAEGLAPTSLFT